MTRLFKTAGFVLVLFTSGSALANDGQDAKTFIASLFATYHDNSRPPAGAGKIYASSLQALMDEDVRLAKGEVPALDFDPICQCQDFSKLQAVIAVRSATAQAAVVMASFHDAGIRGSATRLAVFDLVKEHGAWRIGDIHADDPKSLRAFLIEQNSERAHPKEQK
jgi:hypothetical protein